MNRAANWLDELREFDPQTDIEKTEFNLLLREIGEESTEQEFIELVRQIRGGQMRPRWVTTMIMMQDDLYRKRELRRWLRFVKGR